MKVKTLFLTFLAVTFVGADTPDGILFIFYVWIDVLDKHYLNNWNSSIVTLAACQPFHLALSGNVLVDCLACVGARSSSGDVTVAAMERKKKVSEKPYGIAIRIFMPLLLL